MTEKRSSLPIGGEAINAMTHGVGVILSIVGLVFLAIISCRRGSAWHIVACSVYGATSVALFAASTLYHSTQNPRRKDIFKVADHCCIYLLIAGSFTPFALVNLRGAWGWSLFGVLWGLALLGILFKIFFIGRFEVASTVFYLLMGWLAIIGIKPIIAAVPPTGVVLLIAGGLFYSVGVIFYAWRKLPYHHALWHLFVLGGSICHYFAVVAGLFF